MTSRIICLLIFFSLFALSASTQAAGKPPTKYSKCPSPVTPANSGGHNFSEDCSTLWVSPPALGKVSLTGLSPSRDKAFCSIVDNLVSVFSSSANSVKASAEKLIQTPTGSPVSPANCSKNKSNLVLARALKGSFTSDVASLDNDISRLESQLSTCGNSCGVLKLRIQTLQSTRSNRSQQLKKVGVLIPYLEQLTVACDVSPTAAGTVSSDFTKLQDDANRAADQLVSLYSKFGTIEGASASLLFEVQWQKLIDDYKSRNPTLAVERLPVDMALSFVTTQADGVALPAVLSVAIPGLSSELKTSDLQNLISSTADVQFGNSASGQVVFSALGACAIGLYSGSPIDTSSIYPRLIANATYRYFVQSERKYKVKYNLVEIYKRIKKVSSSNGLFRSSYETSITNMSTSDEVISVTIESEDPLNAFPDSVEFIADIKRGVLDRALAQVAKAYLPRDSAASLPAVGAGSPGAPKIADSLRKCPNLYCQAGAVVLDLGSALFGGADAASNYLEQNNIAAEESVSDKRMIPQFSTFSFRP